MIKLILALALSFSGCAACDPVPDPIDPPDTDQCAPACQNLRDLGCEEGQPLEDGTTCEAWCAYTQDQGHWLNPTCAVTIESCEELDACGEGGTTPLSSSLDLGAAQIDLEATANVRGGQAQIEVEISVVLFSLLPLEVRISWNTASGAFQLCGSVAGFELCTGS